MSDPSGHRFINDGSDVNYVDSNTSSTLTGTSSSGGSPSDTAVAPSVNSAAVSTMNEMTENTTSSGNQIVSLSSSLTTTTPAAAAAATTAETPPAAAKSTPDDIESTPKALFSLSDGRLIDGKNTLQSFDSAGRPRPASTRRSDGTNNHDSMSMKPPAQPPRIPDGRIIDGKNTLQSFDAPPPHWERLTTTTPTGTNQASDTVIGTAMTVTIPGLNPPTDNINTGINIVIIPY